MTQKRTIWSDELRLISSPSQALTEFLFLEDKESRIGSFSPKTFNNSQLSAWTRDSSGICPPWSIASSIALFPDSPSPICSSSSLSPDLFYSQVSTEFSTPINQSFYTFSIDDNKSASGIEIDEEMEHANTFCSCNHNLQSDYSEDGEDAKPDNSPKSISPSSGYVDASMDPALLNMKLLIINEKQTEEMSYTESCRRRPGDSDTKTPIGGHYSLIIRPKPHHTFSDEMQKKEFEVNAWKEAKQQKLMER
nr:TPA_asm: hypothetical protein HUJ06_017709 [Nelumbo nucifera]